MKKILQRSRSLFVEIRSIRGYLSFMSLCFPIKTGIIRFLRMPKPMGRGRCASGSNH
jgi:hypothetical protein